MQVSDRAGGTPLRENKWTVHRQDDNGNRFVVQTGLSQEEAEQLVAVFEARGHKQLYWVEPDRPAPG